MFALTEQALAVPRKATAWHAQYNCELLRHTYKLKVFVIPLTQSASVTHYERLDTSGSDQPGWLAKACKSLLLLLLLSHD